MWVFMSTGFVSAVQHRDDPTRVLVRARERKALEFLLDNVELAGAEVSEAGVPVETVTADDIREDLKADYRWRVEMSKATFALAVQFEILNFLDYDNFKNRLEVTRGEDYHDAAMEVWWTMRELDPRYARPKVSKKLGTSWLGTSAGSKSGVKGFKA